MRRWLSVLLAVGLCITGVSVIEASAEDLGNGRCAGGIYPDAQTAKSNFGNDCGKPFEETTDHRCDWVSGGWQCQGPGKPVEDSPPPADDTPPPAEDSPPADDSPSPTESNRPLVAPGFRSVGYNAAGFVSVIWNPAAPDGVNIYRNDDYVTTIWEGNVFNDHAGRPGDAYYLVRVRDGQFSSKSAEKVAAAATSRVNARLHIPQGMELSWTPQTGVRYRVRRLDNGGAVAPGRGTLLTTTAAGAGSFVDQEPRRGASYGVEGVKPDGTVLPIVSVSPNYSDPVVHAHPTAFESAIHWQGGSEYAVQADGFTCRKSADLDERFCNVPGPGTYRVTHIPSGKGWAITARPDSPIVPKMATVNGVRIPAADTYYGTVVLAQDKAQLEAATGTNFGPLPGARQSAVRGEDYIYSTVIEGMTAAETSVVTTIVTVWEVDENGEPKLYGYYVHGEFITPEQMTHRMEAAGIVVDQIIGLLPINELIAWGRDLLNDILDWLEDPPPPGTPPNDSDSDGNTDCVGSNCHNGVELNEQTDPDGDGLSVLADDDNDNDGYKFWEDEDDLDPDEPTVGGKPETGGGGGGGGGGGTDTTDPPTTSPPQSIVDCLAGRSC